MLPLPAFHCHLTLPLSAHLSCTVGVLGLVPQRLAGRWRVWDAHHRGPRQPPHPCWVQAQRRCACPRLLRCRLCPAFLTVAAFLSLSVHLSCTVGFGIHEEIICGDVAREHSEKIRVVYKVEGMFPVNYHRGVVRFEAHKGGEVVPCQGDPSHTVTHGTRPVTDPADLVCVSVCAGAIDCGAMVSTNQGTIISWKVACFLLREPPLGL